MEGLILLINGPDEGRRAVRKLVKDGVEWIKTYPTGDAAAPDTADHHTLCMTFEEMARRRRRGPQLPPQGHRPLPGDPGDQERAPGRLRHASSTARSWTTRRSTCCWSANTPVVPALQFEYGEHREGARVRHAAGGGRRPQGDARRGRRERPDDPQGRRPARHGRRLRLRLEPARRLRQGADVLRPATSASRRWKRSPAPPGPAPRSWAAATSSARSSRASWPTCWSSTATCSPTSPCWRTARDSSR